MKVPAPLPDSEFQWSFVIWTPPTSLLPTHCAYCHDKVGQDEQTMMVFKEDGSQAGFCKKCLKTYWGRELVLDYSDSKYKTGLLIPKLIEKTP